VQKAARVAAAEKTVEAAAKRESKQVQKGQLKETKASGKGRGRGRGRGRKAEQGKENEKDAGNKEEDALEMEVPKPAPKKASKAKAKTQVEEAPCENAIKFDWETKARPVRELKHGNVLVPKDFRGQAKSYTLWTLNSLYVNTVVNNNLGVKVNAKGGATL
ncbi:guaA, partial [Symbiodinium sp. CCMP2592]